MQTVLELQLKEQFCAGVVPDPTTKEAKFDQNPRWAGAEIYCPISLYRASLRTTPDTSFFLSDDV